MAVEPAGELRQSPELEAVWTLLEGVASAVLVCEQGWPLYANAAALQLCESLPADAVSLPECLVEADRPQWRQLMEESRSAATGTAVRRTLRFEAAAADSTARWVDVSVINVAHGSRLLQVCTLQPATTAISLPIQTSEADDGVLARLVNGFPGLAYRVRIAGDWHFELVSDGCESLTGYAGDQFLSGAVAYRQMVHPEDRAMVDAQLQAALDEHRCYQLVYRLITARQHEKWVWEHGVGMYDASGRPQAVEGFIVDITERKRRELKIREGQRSLATLVSNLQGMAYRCSHSREWDMYFVSDGCFQLTGYASSELLYSRTVAYGDLVHPADRDEAVAAVERAVAENRPFRVVYRIITAAGQEKLVWDQGSGVFSESGEVTELEGFITEVASPDEPLRQR